MIQKSPGDALHLDKIDRDNPQERPVHSPTPPVPAWHNLAAVAVFVGLPTAALASDAMVNLTAR